MTWPFENDTSAITKKLANKSLQSEKRRNLMVVIAVALAAFLICFTGIVSTSLTQMQRNQVVDTYEAVWMGVEENDIETLKGVPEFERVGGYYMLGEELSEQGYHASYVYCDAQMMEIAKAQMELLEGRVPEKANEVVVSEYFLSTYAEKVNGVWEQRLRIHYNCVGTIEIPSALPLPTPDVSVNTRKGVVVNYAHCDVAI